LPDSPRPLPIKVVLRSKVKHHFDAEGEYEYQGGGNLVIKNAAPEFFQPPRTVFVSSLPGTTRQRFFNMVLTGYLSRVRETTPLVLSELAKVPRGLRPNPAQPGKKRQPFSKALPDPSLHPWPPTTWQPRTLTDFNYIADPPVAGGNLQFDKQTITPATQDLVLEVAHVKAPQMIAVSWPNALTRTAKSPAVPFLIFFRPTVGQNIAFGFYEGNGQKPYPLGWDYLFFGLYMIINYNLDPLTLKPFSKGIVYQVAASGKNAVVISGMNRSVSEMGAFQKAGDMEEILEEVKGFMFRRSRIYTPPALGHVALGAFSSGGMLAEALLQSVVKSKSLQALREVYFFDRGFGFTASTRSVVDTAIAWAGKDADKIVRIYSQIESSGVPNYRTLVGSTPPPGPSLTLSADGKRSVAVLPLSAWKKFGPWKDGQDVHQLISAIMLTDALRRSAF
jgi:hypothetical protein